MFGEEDKHERDGCCNTKRSKYFIFICLVYECINKHCSCLKRNQSNESNISHLPKSKLASEINIIDINLNTMKNSGSNYEEVKEPTTSKFHAISEDNNSGKYPDVIKLDDSEKRE